MTSTQEFKILDRIRERLQVLYGNNTTKYLKRLQMLIGRYGIRAAKNHPPLEWSEKDCLLITYGDSIIREKELPLQTLTAFMDDHLDGVINGVHILPFFPFSSDDGFSVIDYRKVRSDLGGWWNIRELSERYFVMADLVINHVSAQSSWFEDYKDGVSPAAGFFIEADPENEALSEVTRPRTSPLLTPVETINGRRHVWSTFSDDQIDLDFSNPDVLFEMLDIIQFYISNGVSTIRLDAIAYLWKEIGTSCIHLNETHEVVKLIRDFLRLAAPHVTMITETNVPHQENISYFGNGDEAHMIYQFSLPPLMLHALLFGRADYLTQWADELETPPEGCYYFNFLSSHDGIGVRPIEGLIPDKEFKSLIDTIVNRGGYVSYRENNDGSLSPYELNITYFSALVNDDATGDERLMQIRRFIVAHNVMMSLKGVPAIYIHSLLGCSNDEVGVQSKGHNRAINRRQWVHTELEDLLADSDSDQRIVLDALLEQFRIRVKQPAFHPDSPQIVHDIGNSVFAFSRIHGDPKQHIVCINNLTENEVTIELSNGNLPFSSASEVKNLLSGKNIKLDDHSLLLDPYQSLWLEL